MNTKLSKPMASIPLAIALALALAAGGTTIANAQQGGACLDKRQIQEAVSSGEILSLDAVLANAGIDSSQSVLSVEVCDEGGRLVYIIGVLSPSGEAENLVLSAQ
jgi:uncharacterized membrane protein YkoI